MVQPNQQHVAPSVKRVEWGIGHERFDSSSSVWASITVSSTQTAEVTQEADEIPRRKGASIGTPFLSPHTTHKEKVGVFYPLTHRGWWDRYTSRYTGHLLGCVDANKLEYTQNLMETAFFCKSLYKWVMSAFFFVSYISVISQDTNF